MQDYSICIISLVMGLPLFGMFFSREFWARIDVLPRIDRKSYVCVLSGTEVRWIKNFNQNVCESSPYLMCN